jgi:hypothetical protein
MHQEERKKGDSQEKREGSKQAGHEAAEHEQIIASGPQIMNGKQGGKKKSLRGGGDAQAEVVAWLEEIGLMGEYH